MTTGYLTVTLYGTFFSTITYSVVGTRSSIMVVNGTLLVIVLVVNLGGATHEQGA